MYDPSAKTVKFAKKIVILTKSTCNSGVSLYAIKNHSK